MKIETDKHTEEYIATAQSKDARFYYGVKEMLWGNYRIEKTDGMSIVGSW